MNIITDKLPLVGKFVIFLGILPPWRGDKNYQSKAGQAFQGVELKKIEG